MKNVLYKWCPVNKKVMEAALVQDAREFHNVIMDDMPPTKHPATGEIFTSKARFRAATKAAGCEEVGTAYEHGYRPEAARERSFKERIRLIKAEIKERLNG